MTFPIYFKEHRIILKKNSQAKTLRLRLDPVHKIPILVAPKRCSQKRIKAFLEESYSWLEQQIQDIPDISSPLTHLWFKGESYEIDHAPFQLGKSLVFFDPSHKKAYVKEKGVLLKTHLKRELKQIAYQECKLWCQKFSEALGVSFKEIRIKEYRERWGGCCASRGILTFSWRLMMAPPMVLEYVCAHEVSHLRHMNHSSDFWKTLALLYHDYETPRLWLKKQGGHLFKIL